MNVTIAIPDELAARLGSSAELERRALEGLAVEEYRARRLTEFELQNLLGFETRYELDGFLKDRGVFHDYTAADLERERETLKQLGL